MGTPSAAPPRPKPIRFRDLPKGWRPTLLAEWACLAFIDEWDRSPAAIKNHFVRSDGAGSIARGHFWWTREYLFPKGFRAYRSAGPPDPPQRQ